VTKSLKKVGTFGTKFTQCVLACAEFDDEGWCYTGGDNGQIQVWGLDYSVVRCIKAHSGTISALSTEGNKLLCGSKDGKVTIIQILPNCNFKLEKQVDAHALPFLAHLPKSFPISMDYYKGNMLVGLRNGCIIEVRDKEGPRIL